MQETFPAKFRRVECERLTLCLPDPRTLTASALRRETFFDLHILKEEDGENNLFVCGTNSGLGLLVERRGSELKLLSAPAYKPSFKKGIYTAKILSTHFGVNKVRIL